MVHPTPLASTSQDCQGHEKTRKDSKTDRPEDTTDTTTKCQCGTLDEILEQKMDMNGKTGEIRIMPGV